MHGQWSTDERGIHLDASPFEIQSQGMGLFAHDRNSWPGFNPLFRGFGGEEGYLQEKVRQHGGHVRCLPFLRWVHRFPRPHGTPYKVRTWDKCRNALIGHVELGLDPRPVMEHFLTLLPYDVVEQVVISIHQEMRVDEGTDLFRILANLRAEAVPIAGEEASPDFEALSAEPPPRG
jgi:hypothetical protein